LIAEGAPHLLSVTYRTESDYPSYVSQWAKIAETKKQSVGVYF